MVLDFYHVPSGYSVAFKGMINAFSDQYTSEWNTEVVYGRMDPIAMFQGTARQISLEWDVVAGSVEEAKLNMAKCEMLMAMLYPTYNQEAGSAQTSNSINSSPLFKFKFGNFAHDAKAGPNAGTSRASQAGLTGFIGGFTFEPDFESGIIDCPDGEAGMFYPQRLTLSAEFTVLHSHDMGWIPEGGVPKLAERTGQNTGQSAVGLAQPGFPYNSPGSHQSGWEGFSGRGADGASGTRADTRRGQATEGSDPNDDNARIQALALGLK